MTRATISRPGRTSRAKPSARQIKTFRNAVAYLDSLINYERIVGPQYTSAKFGLSRMSRIVSALGNPQRSYKTVHIAGTKGKGSTSAMLAAMLRGCGLRVGLYTSPHILNIRERIAINGDNISESAFARHVAAVGSITNKAKVPDPTYFEVLTAAAFRYFAHEEVDIAVIETGMGGRLDSTNVITPEAVGLTSISMDHLQQLGRTIEAITREKCGVIKKKVPVISAPQPESVRAIIREAAAAAEAPLRFADEGVDFSYRFEFSRTAGRHARICLTTPNSKFEHVHVPLLGEHQAINCTLALGLLDTLKTRNIPVDDHAATEALSTVALQGRMQMICEEPRILVDGAHNAASVDALMRAIGQNITYDSMVVIFACQKDKDIPGMIRRIQLGADKVIFTGTGSPRTAEPADLAAMYIEHSGKMAQVARTLDDAMRIALGAVGREDLICVTGSFYLVAEAMKKYSKGTGALKPIGVG